MNNSDVSPLLLGSSAQPTLETYHDWKRVLKSTAATVVWIPGGEA